MRRYYLNENGTIAGAWDGRAVEWKEEKNPFQGLEYVTSDPASMSDIWDRDQKIWKPAAVSYRDARALEYLPTGDQLDAVLKGLDYLRQNGETLPDETNAVIDHWLSVKAKFPKQ